MGINSRFLNLDTDVTLSSNSDEIIPSQKAIKTYVDTKDSNVVHKTGDESIAGTKTFTGKVVSPIVETGTAASNYFQCQKFRGEGNASTYYHAIDFGYAKHDQVDFYEYGGKWVFHKHTGSSQSTGDTVVGQILSTGWNGPVVGDVTGNLTGTASKATADADGNTISSTYTKKTDIMTGATSSAAGTSGLVPVPSAGDQDKFLKGDGTWSPVSGGSSITADGTTIVNNSGTISTVAIKEQRASTAIKEWVGTKAQYDAISTKDNNTKYVITDDYDSGIVVDNALSTTSTNAVENRVITNAIQNMATAKTRFTGEIIESSVPLSDAGLHLLDGSVIIGNGSYSEFVTYMAGKVSTNPELFTTEANWQQSITDFGVCSKFVYSSGDNSIRLPNVSTSKRYLIDSYKNGSAWYNIYSDGWCEQGNITNVPSAGTTVNLVKPFVDTNYVVVSGGYDGTNANGKFGNTSANVYTTSSFAAWTSDDDSFNAGDIAWTAYGYVDISTLKLNAIYQYIVIANVTNTQVEIDINEVMADVNNKVDKDDLGQIQCVVESYSNGTSWYRVWSDGWCEQGDYFIGLTGTQTVNLFKEYVNSNYSISISETYTSTLGDRRTINNANKTPSSFQIFVGSTSTVGIYWETKGYIL